MPVRFSMLEITTVIGCKINCRYCPQEKLTRNYFRDNNCPDSVLKFENFKIFIDKIPNRVRIDFSGMAEPWLNSECTKMLLYAQEKGHKIAVYTTLVGMYYDDFEKIKDLQYEVFNIHLPDERNNSHIPVTEEYLLLLEKFIKTSPLSLMNKLEFSCHGPVHHEVLKIIKEKSSRMLDRAGNLENTDLKHKVHKGNIICTLTWKSIDRNVLLPDGTVLFCGMDYGMRHVLGNLGRDGYEDLFKSEEAKKIMKGFDDSTIDILCRHCSKAANPDIRYHLEDMLRTFKHKLETSRFTSALIKKLRLFMFMKKIK